MLLLSEFSFKNSLTNSQHEDKSRKSTFNYNSILSIVYEKKKLFEAFRLRV
jgi:hypothetical protein